MRRLPLYQLAAAAQEAPPVLLAVGALLARSAVMLALLFIVSGSGGRRGSFAAGIGRIGQRNLARLVCGDQLHVVILGVAGDGQVLRAVRQRGRRALDLGGDALQESLVVVVEHGRCVLGGFLLRLLRLLEREVLHDVRERRMVLGIEKNRAENSRYCGWERAVGEAYRLRRARNLMSHTDVTEEDQSMNLARERVKRQGSVPSEAL